MQYNPPRPTVDQEVFSLNVGNNARNQEQVLTPMVVSKVGRKYFSAKRADDAIGYSETQYHLDTWIQKTEFCANSRIFPTKQEWYDEQEAALLSAEFKTVFGFGYAGSKQLSLTALLAIKDIIDNDKQK